MKQAFRYYGQGIPYIKEKDYIGQLIVVEGPDYAGRSTHIMLLQKWLESEGHAVLSCGLSRSTLIGEAIQDAKEGNVLGKKTLSLLYATDFADQLENKVLPALKAGYVVLLDRYIFTLMARDMARGASKEWLVKLFGFAPIPNLIFFLEVSPQVLIYRALKKYAALNFWESGMDMSFSNDTYESFLIYQSLIANYFDEMIKEYDFIVLDGGKDSEIVQGKMKKSIIEYFIKMGMIANDELE